MSDEERRRLLMDAAVAVFAASGLSAPVSAITARAGLGISAFYRSFASKDVLIEELALERLNWIAAIWNDALTTADAWQGFTDAVVLFVRELELHPALLASLHRRRDDEDPRFVRALDHRERALRAVLARAVAEGTLRDDVTTEDIRAIFNAFTAVSSESGSGGRDQAFRLLALLLDGLRTTSRQASLEVMGSRYRDLADPALAPSSR